MKRGGIETTELSNYKELNRMNESLNNAENPPCFIHGVMCRIFGHKWKYNFSSVPNKAICTRCKAKAKLDLHTLEWESVKTFEGEKRTDDELCSAWVS